MFEKVSPAHPDKMCDRLAGAIVDLAYSKEKNPRIAVEVLAGHGKVFIIIETSLSREQLSCAEIDPIVWRIFGNDVEINVTIVPQDPILAHNQDNAMRVADNGIFKGSAPTYEQKALTAIAASIYDKHPSDGKYIIQGSGRLAAPVFDVTVCQSHLSKDEEPDLRQHLIAGYHINGNIIINPLGEWTGGPDVDCGATNRKLGSDMGDGVSGGGINGKDLSKGDVSINIVAFLLAQRYGTQIEACCSIGDEHVTFNGYYCAEAFSKGLERLPITMPFSDVVEMARLYILTDCNGSFEEFAKWGLIRPKE